ncbi:hypothetical protein FKM82_016764 [Ascaphus truei]
MNKLWGLWGICIKANVGQFWGKNIVQIMYIIEKNPIGFNGIFFFDTYSMVQGVFAPQLHHFCLDTYSPTVCGNTKLVQN